MNKKKYSVQIAVRLNSKEIYGQTVNENMTDSLQNLLKNRRG